MFFSRFLLGFLWFSRVFSRIFLGFPGDFLFLALLKGLLGIIFFYFFRGS